MESVQNRWGSQSVCSRPSDFSRRSISNRRFSLLTRSARHGAPTLMNRAWQPTAYSCNSPYISFLSTSCLNHTTNALLVRKLINNLNAFLKNIYAIIQNKSFKNNSAELINKSNITKKLNILFKNKLHKKQKINFLSSLVVERSILFSGWLSTVASFEPTIGGSTIS